MKLALYEITLEDDEKLVSILLDADEDEERIRRALVQRMFASPSIEGHS